MDSARTCLGCRIRTDKASLLRVVERHGIVTPDPSAILQGRGGWVHPARACVETAIKRKAFGRALRVSTALDMAQLLASPEQTNATTNEMAD